MTRRHRIDAAINYALERRWDLAAAENRSLLEEDGTDVESANRLGKALTELGDTKGAIEAYQRALSIDPTNAIARKNLARLEEQRKVRRPKAAPATKAKATTAAARKKVDAQTTPARRIDVAAESLRNAPLIEEYGKSADLVLERVPKAAADEVAIGDPAELEPTQRGVAVRTQAGTLLGQLDPRTGLRLRRMIEGGNRYSVVVRRIEGDQVTVHVRETFKDPSLVGQASFLAQAGDPRRKRAAPRAYTKTSVLHYDRTDDDDDFDVEEEDDVWRPRGTTAELDGGNASEDDDDFSESVDDDDAFDTDDEDDED